MRYEDYMMESVCSALDELVDGGALTEAQADEVYALAENKYMVENKFDKAVTSKANKYRTMNKLREDAVNDINDAISYFKENISYVKSCIKDEKFREAEKYIKQSRSGIKDVRKALDKLDDFTFDKIKYKLFTGINAAASVVTGLGSAATVGRLIVDTGEELDTDVIRATSAIANASTSIKTGKAAVKNKDKLDAVRDKERAMASIKKSDFYKTLDEMDKVLSDLTEKIKKAKK